MKLLRQCINRTFPAVCQRENVNASGGKQLPACIGSGFSSLHRGNTSLEGIHGNNDMLEFHGNTS